MCPACSLELKNLRHWQHSSILINSKFNSEKNTTKKHFIELGEMKLPPLSFLCKLVHHSYIPMLEIFKNYLVEILENLDFTCWIVLIRSTMCGCLVKSATRVRYLVSMCLVIRFVRSDMTTCSFFLQKFPTKTMILFGVRERRKKGFCKLK